MSKVWSGCDDVGLWTLDIGLSAARVAQLTERWSYKPEAEGLNPSLGTNTNYEPGMMNAEREVHIQRSSLLVHS